MLCPRCNTRTLSAVETDTGTTTDFCSTCGGVWFDKDEIEAFMSWKTPPERLETEVDLVNCPRCETPTLKGFKYRFGGPPLDGCSTCTGVWCDRGEVASLKLLAPKIRLTNIEGNQVMQMNKLPLDLGTCLHVFVLLSLFGLSVHLFGVEAAIEVVSALVFIAICLLWQGFLACRCIDRWAGQHPRSPPGP